MHCVHTTHPPQPEKRISVMVPVDHCERLDAIAKAEYRTFSQELRRLIAERVKEKGE